MPPKSEIMKKSLQLLASLLHFAVDTIKRLSVLGIPHVGMKSKEQGRIVCFLVFPEVKSSVEDSFSMHFLEQVKNDTSR